MLLKGMLAVNDKSNKKFWDKFAKLYAPFMKKDKGVYSKLFFGVDYCTIKNYRELSHFLDEGVENGRISQKAYNKICRENLLALVEG